MRSDRHCSASLCPLAAFAPGCGARRDSVSSGKGSCGHVAWHRESVSRGVSRRTHLASRPHSPASSDRPRHGSRRAPVELDRCRLADRPRHGSHRAPVERDVSLALRASAPAVERRDDGLTRCRSIRPPRSDARRRPPRSDARSGLSSRFPARVLEDARTVGSECERAVCVRVALAEEGA